MYRDSPKAEILFHVDHGGLRLLKIRYTRKGVKIDSLRHFYVN